MVIKIRINGFGRIGRRLVLKLTTAKEEDITIILDVNEEKYDPAKHHILFGTSCTMDYVSPASGKTWPYTPLVNKQTCEPQTVTQKVKRTISGTHGPDENEVPDQRASETTLEEILKSIQEPKMKQLTKWDVAWVTLQIIGIPVAISAAVAGIVAVVIAVVKWT